jgi:hypothetical protein
MKYTKIQWCHSTINPVMGCDGCELWKSAPAIAAIMLTMLILLTKKPKATLRQAIARAVGDRKTSELYRDRERVAHDQASQSEPGATILPGHQPRPTPRHMAANNGRNARQQAEARQRQQPQYKARYRQTLLRSLGWAHRQQGRC